jgi:hypothetical protein
MNHPALQFGAFCVFSVDRQALHGDFAPRAREKNDAAL